MGLLQIKWPFCPDVWLLSQVELFAWAYFVRLRLLFNRNAMQWKLGSLPLWNYWWGTQKCGLLTSRSRKLALTSIYFPVIAPLRSAGLSWSQTGDFNWWSIKLKRQKLRKGCTEHPVDDFWLLRVRCLQHKNRLRCQQQSTICDPLAVHPYVDVRKDYYAPSVSLYWHIEGICCVAPSLAWPAQWSSLSWRVLRAAASGVWPACQSNLATSLCNGKGASMKDLSPACPVNAMHNRWPPIRNGTLRYADDICCSCKSMQSFSAQSQMDAHMTQRHQCKPFKFLSKTPPRWQHWRSFETAYCQGTICNFIPCGVLLHSQHLRVHRCYSDCSIRMPCEGPQARPHLSLFQLAQSVLQQQVQR